MAANALRNFVASDKSAMIRDFVSGDKVYDVFVTDLEYESDETAGAALCYSPLALGSRTVQLMDSDVVNPNRAAIKLNSLVRFVNEDTHVVTQYMRVTVAPERFVSGVAYLKFDVDTAVVLADGPTYFACHVARTWIPKSLKLATRFKDVTAVEVRRINWTGLSASTLEDQADLLHDYMGLEIQEIPGTVMSTNRWMHKVLAVIPTHPPGPLATVYEDTRDATVELAPGDAKTSFDSPITLSQLTPRLIDRKGKPIIVARLHIWLRIWAELA